MEKLIQYATKASFYDGPFDDKTGWAAAGMGYILRTKNGKLIVIDGGLPEDAEALVQLLEENAPHGKPVVDQWIITHPHLDHYGALLRICEEAALVSRLEIRRLLYRFPAEFVDSYGGNLGYATPHFEMILTASGAEALTPFAGMETETDGMQIRFLYAPEDCSLLDNPNQLSLIFSVHGHKKRLLFTGDAYERNLKIVLESCPEKLPCDILQLPHHGLCDTGYIPFYRQANASTVLIPISIAGDRTMRSDMYGSAPEANRFAENHASNVYKACNGTVELPLD